MMPHVATADEGQSLLHVRRGGSDNHRRKGLSSVGVLAGIALLMGAVVVAEAVYVRTSWVPAGGTGGSWTLLGAQEPAALGGAV